MFEFIRVFFSMLSNFVTGTNSYINAYSEGGKWCEESMKGFNDVAALERDIKLTELKAALQLKQQETKAAVAAGKTK